MGRFYLADLMIIATMTVMAQCWGDMGMQSYTNIAMFAMPLGAYWNPTIHEPFEGVNRIAYIITHTIFDLKMMALFSMLFGAGVILYARKAAGPAQTRRVRGLWLRRLDLRLSSNCASSCFCALVSFIVQLRCARRHARRSRRSAP